MFKLMKKMKKGDMALFIVAILFIWLQVDFDMSIPGMLQHIMDIGHDQNLTFQEVTQKIETTSEIIMFFIVTSFVLSAISTVIVAKAVMGFVTTLRFDVFKKVQGLAVRDVDNYTVSGLITRSTSDVMNLQVFLIMGFQAIIKAPIISIWALTAINEFGVDWRESVLTAIVFIVILVVVCLAISTPQTRIVQKNIDSTNKIVMEKLGGVDVIRAYNSEHKLNGKFSAINETLSKALRKSQIPSAIMIPGLNISLNLVAAFVYFDAIDDINTAVQGQQLGVISNIVAFIPYTAQLLMSFLMVVQVLIFYPRVKVSSKRILEILETKPSICDEYEDEEAESKRRFHRHSSKRVKKHKSMKGEGSIEFRNVSFSYHDTENYFMKDINFKCPSGSTLAIIGSIGSGKTTLINLLMRYYDVSKGEVLVGGVNVKDYSLYDLRNKISLTAQKALLFTGTIESNVKYGNDVEKSPYGIDKTCDIAGAKPFIREFDQRYKTPVLKHGTNFSGGQRQRISIARTLSKPCDILVFDDSFSALDYKTERAVRKSILENFEGVTKVIISQRISTIREADQIIVLDNGSIKGIGTHDELMLNCKDYQEIYASQNSDDNNKSERKEELA